MTITSVLESSCHLKGSRTIDSETGRIDHGASVKRRKLSSMVHFAWANVQMVFV